MKDFFDDKSPEEIREWVRCEIFWEMDYWAYEHECREYYGIHRMPTEDEYYNFLRNCKYKSFFELAGMSSIY